MKPFAPHSIAGHLASAQTWLWAATRLREQKRELTDTLLLMADSNRRVEREINRRIRTDAHVAIYHALKAAVLLRTHTGPLV